MLPLAVCNIICRWLLQLFHILDTGLTFESFSFYGDFDYNAEIKENVFLSASVKKFK